MYHNLNNSVPTPFIQITAIPATFTDWKLYLAKKKTGLVRPVFLTKHILIPVYTGP